MIFNSVPVSFIESRWSVFMPDPVEKPAPDAEQPQVVFDDDLTDPHAEPEDLPPHLRHLRFFGFCGGSDVPDCEDEGDDDCDGDDE
jgi:hypothetical protein